MLLLTMLLTVCAPGPRNNCVVDGDTFWLAGEKIRLADIDAPEISKPQCPAEKALGERAKQRLLVLLNSGEIGLRRDGTDRYGRTLAVVIVGGRSVGSVLVEEGLARVWDGRRHPWC